MPRNLNNAHTRIDKSALFWTLCVHIVLFVFVTWQLRWVAPKVVEIELWDAGSLGAMDAPTTQNPSINEVTPTLTESVAAPSVKESNTAPSSELNATEIQTQKTKPNASNTTQKPNEKPTQTNSSLRDTILKQAQKNTSPATSGASHGNGKGASSEYGAYIAKVKSMIENRGRNQGLSGSAGSVQFRVAPNGSVSAVTVSGLPADKANILKQLLSGFVLPRDPNSGGIPAPALSSGMRFSVRF